MSLITRCPACATQFKVVPDQLKLSDGWVRCGHCSDVFDATRYLHSGSSGAATPPKPSGVQQAPPFASREPSAQPSGSVASSALREATVPSSPAVENGVLPLNSTSVPATRPADDLDRSLALNGPDLPLDIAQTHLPEAGWFTTAPRLNQDTTEQENRNANDASDFHTELQRFVSDQGKPPGGGRVAKPASLQPPSPAPAPAPAPAPVSLPPSPPPSPSAFVAAAAQQGERKSAPSLDDDEAGMVAALEPSFVRQARRRAFWRSPGVRVMLTLVALLLSGLLAAQWALQERDRLAARHPDWQPLLTSLCQPLGCTIGAARDLQAVVIESSTLTRRLGDFYSFDLVLKNTADTPLAVPALELSLTDTADTVISRRVFLPGDMSGVPPLLPPQDTVPISLRLSLVVGSELPMAGYRALVFYP